MIHTVYTVYTWLQMSQIRVSKTERCETHLTQLPPRSVVPPSEARTTSAPAEWATWLTDFHGWQAWVQAVWKKF